MFVESPLGSAFPLTRFWLSWLLGGLPAHRRRKHNACRRRASAHVNVLFTLCRSTL